MGLEVGDRRLDRQGQMYPLKDDDGLPYGGCQRMWLISEDWLMNCEKLKKIENSVN